MNIPTSTANLHRVARRSTADNRRPSRRWLATAVLSIPVAACSGSAGSATPSAVAAYISSTDLPSLQSQAGYKLVKQDSVKVGSSNYHHVVYHILSPADPVTGKQVPSTVDRYYVPGTSQLAVVSLSTPDGVDNVD